MKLIIVESPTKARTISQFLGKNFAIESCNGHVRDLPRGKLGVDIENNFQPQYVIPTQKRKLVNQLKKIATEADLVYYATDEDREGEAIAWHLAQVLKLKKSEALNSKSETNSKLQISNFRPYQRIVFHEITEEAVKEAIKNPREIDLHLVNAQQARRILDRLVGYELSPFLWAKIAKGLSAGRAQSPTLRLIVERENEIKNFKPDEYWTIVAILASTKLRKHKKVRNFEATLYKIDDKILDKFTIKTKNEANQILQDLEDVEYIVSGVNQKETKKFSLPPFSTSTLQQEANKKLGFSVKKTMVIAQQLYEGIELGKEGSIGLITYMRTDSLNLAEKFLNEAKGFIKKDYGQEYFESHQYKTRSKVAQEAHEAIRPTSCLRTPEKIRIHLNKDQFKLYDLIWRRSISSQMKPAIFINTTIDIKAKKSLFRATGSSLKFDGWLKIYPERQKETELPPLEVNEKLQLLELKPEQHFTEPPPRYNEASLVKILESLGIGRPSTYVAIISTLQTRNYVRKEKRSFIPSEIGFMVNDLLTKHFSEIVDYQFTSRMEDELDKIANGEIKWLPMIKNFYKRFKENLIKKEKEIVKNFIEEKTDEVCEKCGKPMLVKFSRYGKFLACSGFPECRYTKSLNNEEPLMKCPKCKEGEVVRKRTKKGKFFFACNRWPECDFASWQKPKNDTSTNKP